MRINEIIRDIRKQLNITQEQLAHDLSISFSTINRWENGRNTLSKLAKLRLIEYCIGKNIDEEIIERIKEL